MTMPIITRAQANLPPVPSGVGHRDLSSWTGVKVHHTGGAFSSWRAIHDWQTQGRPEAEQLIDIGYSFGIANGRVTELRGWDRSPAHDHQNSTIGVVLGGNYQSLLPPAEDLAALVWFCQEARRRTGKRLLITGHRDTWPRGDSRYSSCPGDRLYAYLPTLRTRVDNQEDDDMPSEQIVAKEVLHDARYPRADAAQQPEGNKDISLASSAEWGRKHAADTKAAVATQVLPMLAAIQDQLSGGNNIVEVVRFAVREELMALVPLLANELGDAVPTEMVEAAMRRVLGSLDNQPEGN